MKNARQDMVGQTSQNNEHCDSRGSLSWLRNLERVLRCRTIKGFVTPMRSNPAQIFTI